MSDSEEAAIKKKLEKAIAKEDTREIDDEVLVPLLGAGASGLKPASACAFAAASSLA